MSRLRHYPGGRDPSNGLGQAPNDQDGPILARPDSAHHHDGQPHPNRPLTGRGRSALSRQVDHLDITDVVVDRVVPNILARHGPGENMPVGLTRLTTPSWALGHDQVQTFASLLRRGDTAGAFDLVEDLRREGAALDDIFLDLMSPAAQLLGEYWKSDDIDFVDVTVGVSRMQHVLHSLMTEFEGVPRQMATSGAVSRAYIATMPGEQHSFGTLMVSGFLRRYGWDVWCDAPDTEQHIFSHLAMNPCDMVGFSLSRADQVDKLGALIKNVRNVCANGDMCVLIGGPAVVCGTVQASDVGADGAAAEARTALRMANEMIEKRQKASNPRLV